jgi:hypothetical protein
MDSRPGRFGDPAFVHLAGGLAMSISKSILVLAASAAFTAFPAAAQQEPLAPEPGIAGEPAAAEPVIAEPVIAEPATVGPTGATDVLDNDELGELRGGEGIVLSNQTLVAITSGNIIQGDYVAGNVSLSDNALSNFAGLGNLMINTGGQVSLQTGMNVTINVGE